MEHRCAKERKKGQNRTFFAPIRDTRFNLISCSYLGALLCVVVCFDRGELRLTRLTQPGDGTEEVQTKVSFQRKTETL